MSRSYSNIIWEVGVKGNMYEEEYGCIQKNQRNSYILDHIPGMFKTRCNIPRSLFEICPKYCLAPSVVGLGGVGTV